MVTNIILGKLSNFKFFLYLNHPPPPSQYEEMLDKCDAHLYNVHFIHAGHIPRFLESLLLGQDYISRYVDRYKDQKIDCVFLQNSARNLIICNKHVLNHF